MVTLIILIQQVWLNDVMDFDKEENLLKIWSIWDLHMVHIVSGEDVSQLRSVSLANKDIKVRGLSQI